MHSTGWQNSSAKSTWNATTTDYINVLASFVDCIEHWTLVEQIVGQMTATGKSISVERKCGKCITAAVTFLLASFVVVADVMRWRLFELIVSHIVLNTLARMIFVCISVQTLSRILQKENSF